MRPLALLLATAAATDCPGGTSLVDLFDRMDMEMELPIYQKAVHALTLENPTLLKPGLDHHRWQVVRATCEDRLTFSCFLYSSSFARYGYCSPDFCSSFAVSFLRHVAHS